MSAWSPSVTHTTTLTVTVRHDHNPYAIVSPRATTASSSVTTTSTRVTFSHSSDGSFSTTVTQSRYEDIDDSDLPDGIKAVLRQMREIQEQLRQATDELQALLADARMDTEKRRIRVETVQARITALLGAQSELSAELLKRVRVQQLSTTQQQTLGRLLMKTTAT